MWKGRGVVIYDVRGEELLASDALQYVTTSLGEFYLLVMNLFSPNRYLKKANLMDAKEKEMIDR